MTSSDFRVFIPCAGTGSRLGSLSDHINKALITVAGKPSISHIIDKFDAHVPIVIALGYKGDTIRDFARLAYPERTFIFVEVDKFQGEGSGLGYTVLKCQPQLQCPFIFCSNDTIVDELIPAPTRNWMGYAHVQDTTNYRSVRTKDDLVTEICSKGAQGDVKPYIGLAGIKDFEAFWAAMNDGTPGVVEVGESHGLRGLVDRNIHAIHFTWNDTGNLEALARTRKRLSPPGSPVILEKEDEAIWFVGGQVLKFSLNEDFIKKRVERVQFLRPYVPEITGQSRHIYAYKRVEGEIFSKNSRLGDFNYLLDVLGHFWEKKKLDAGQQAKFSAACRDFYQAKTYKRVQQFFDRFEQIDSQETVNGVRLPKVADLLDRVDWDWVCAGIPSRFHGDLHFENILINSNAKTPFTFLDWRQDFGGILEYGDLYYDLAKLNHGLIVSHELIDQQLFHIHKKANTVEFDFLRKQNLVDCENAFREFVLASHYDYKKVRLLTYLVYLNIAALHHYPYSTFLFYLGKSGIAKILAEK